MCLHLLEVDVLVDDSLVPLWIHGLLSVLGPSLVIGTETREGAVVSKTSTFLSPA